MTINETMTREEAIAYLEELKGSVDICYACPEGCMSWDDCKLMEVIAYLNRPRHERLIELLIDAGINITKADPRLDTTHPLTWTELTSVDMIGQPVWNSNTLKWMLVIDSDNLKAWVDLANHAGGTERWIEHYAQKYPLYRMVKS